MSALQPVSGKSHAAGSQTYDVVVVGAGFAGMYMLHRLRGLGLTVRVYEQGGDVGGTWYWNRYPGARCDVESMQYSYSFSDELQQEWDWSERYAPQPEILKYANHVADRFKLRPDIALNTRVDRAGFDESANMWSVTTSDGNTVTAKYVVLATGCLSNARMPDIKGIRAFDRQPVASTTYFAVTVLPSDVVTDHILALSSKPARSTRVLSAISGRSLKRSATWLAYFRISGCGA